MLSGEHNLNNDSALTLAALVIISEQRRISALVEIDRRGA
jgi:hypothetical protein